MGLIGRFNPDKLVFIDETWIKTNMAPLRGWGPRNKRLIGYAPFGHWKTMTFVGALRNDGLVAPCVFDGPINGACFQAYVDVFLVPILKPNDIVIMDNLGSHKAQSIRRAIRNAGAKIWFLPPYSPDLNPIEQTFSKIKHTMRKEQKRTVQDLYDALGPLIQNILPTECANYISNIGYGAAKHSSALVAA